MQILFHVCFYVFGEIYVYFAVHEGAGGDDGVYFFVFSSFFYSGFHAVLYRFHEVSFFFRQVSGELFCQGFLLLIVHGLGLFVELFLCFFLFSSIGLAGFLESLAVLEDSADINLTYSSISAAHEAEGSSSHESCHSDVFHGHESTFFRVGMGM